MSPTIRLLPLECADGPTNMAADEALLESAVAGVASLRFYTWSEPTLSLGYFQPAAERLPGLPWVRRASGGSALIHDRELTYALALPNGVPWQKRGESWVCRFHDIIAQSLLAIGVDVQALACGGEKKLGPALCFWHQTAGDLILNGHKITGSAQRKQRGAVLQHGGILLAQSRFTPGLPGILELTGIEISPATLSGAIAKTFASQSGWVVSAGKWTDTEMKRTWEFKETKYATPAWNEKR